MANFNSTSTQSFGRVIPGVHDLTVEDSNWVLTSSFIIFTMQTGFGMLESGYVSAKNEVNIMIKNIIDIVLGGFTYWLFGHAVSSARGEKNNAYVALEDFLIDPDVTDPLFGPLFAAFLFQLSYSTTATTIVSGAMAERFNFRAYCFFAFFNSIMYAFCAGWVWRENGFLSVLGAVDIAGGGPVHMLGGVCSFAAAVFLGPRIGRFDKGSRHLPMGNVLIAFLGLFILWWAWLSFNTASSFGLSRGRWGYTIRAAVMTMLGSMGGGVVACSYSLIENKGKAQPFQIMNGVLASLVSVTGGCYLFESWSAVLIGAIGSLMCLLSMKLMDKFKIDDPLYACTVHGVGGAWSLISIGLFAMNPEPLSTTGGRSGLLMGGGYSLLVSQLAEMATILVWGLLGTWTLLWVLNKFVRVRLTPEEELMGADLSEHDVDHARNALEEMKPLWEREVELSDGLNYRLSKAMFAAKDVTTGMYKGNINNAFNDGTVVQLDMHFKEQSQINCGVN
uniref:Ammonium transporter n=1 Tax=Aedes aegypti TaxID=7159 RepID=Q1L727_AEDAE|nr:Amt-1-like protein [Aedes aegypti]